MYRLCSYYQNLYIPSLLLPGAQYNNSTLTCMRHVYHTEGLRAFFRGIVPPLLSFGALNALCFGTYAALLPNHRSADTSYTHVFMAGSMAGLACSVMTTPAELLECRAQAKWSPVHAVLEFNPYTCARRIVDTLGVRGLFIGFTATAIRDTPSTGVFFLVYEALCRRWGVRESQNQHDVDLVTVAKLNLAGGLAGTLSWFTYPFDVIKSRLQTQSLTSPEYSGIVDCARKIVHAEGLGVLFRGLTATVIQAFPVSAVMFATYELVIRLCGVGAT